MISERKNKMKKEYITPEIEIYEFDTEVQMTMSGIGKDENDNVVDEGDLGWGL